MVHFLAVLRVVARGAPLLPIHPRISGGARRGIYDSHSRAWEKWLTRVLNSWLASMDPPEDAWRGGLELYDDLDTYYSPGTDRGVRLEIFERVRGNKMLKQFMEDCDLLVAGLRAATPKGQ
jgi:hypothetical protein